jgi:hypothetical protein
MRVSSLRPLAAACSRFADTQGCGCDFPPNLRCLFAGLLFALLDTRFSPSPPRSVHLASRPTHSLAGAAELMAGDRGAARHARVLPLADLGSPRNAPSHRMRCVYIFACIVDSTSTEKCRSGIVVDVRVRPVWRQLLCNDGHRQEWDTDRPAHAPSRRQHSGARV